MDQWIAAQWHPVFTCQVLGDHHAKPLKCRPYVLMISSFSKGNSLAWVASSSDEKANPSRRQGPIPVPRLAPAALPTARPAALRGLAFYVPTAASSLPTDSRVYPGGGLKALYVFYELVCLVEGRIATHTFLASTMSRSLSPESLAPGGSPLTECGRA